jgi:hypothetical protein
MGAARRVLRRAAVRNRDKTNRTGRPIAEVLERGDRQGGRRSVEKACGIEVFRHGDGRKMEARLIVDNPA